jgi:hypothetical protein
MMKRGKKEMMIMKLRLIKMGIGIIIGGRKIKKLLKENKLLLKGRKD